MFYISSKRFKIDFQNRKWNYPNRKWNYFSHFQASDEKTSFTKCFSFDPRGPKLIFKTGNGIIQTGNGFISPTSRPLMKKLLLQNVSHLIQRVQNWFSKQEMELFKQEMELFLQLPGLWSKNLFYKISLICSKWFKIDFQNRKWNYPNRKWNYFSHFQASDSKTSYTNVSHLIQVVQNWFSKHEMELSKQEMELFLPLSGLW